MSRYAPLGSHLAALDAGDAVLSFADVEEILLRSLPASARNHRAWWANDAKGHSQAAAGWLNAGWEVRGVDFQNETVHFHRVRPAPGPQIVEVTPDFLERIKIRTEEPRLFLDGVRDVMIDYFGNRDAGEDLPLFYTRRVGSIPRDFDMVSHDGLKVGQTKLLTHGESERIASSKLASISEIVWLLQRAPARERFIVFAKDARIAQAWLDRYGDHADDVTFYFVHEDRRVDILLPRPGQSDLAVEGE